MMMRAGAGLFRGDDAGEAALAGAEDDDRVAGSEVRHLDGPAKAGADRVEERGDLGWDARVDLVDDSVGIEVEVVRVAAPEAGRDIEADVAVGVEAAVAGAEAVDAGRGTRGSGRRG